MIISRTPVRLSFFGGGTDYREYYLRHGGAVLGTTIDKYVYVSINRLSPFFEYKIRVGYSKAELVSRVQDIIHPSVRECLNYLKVDGNLDIHIFADLPARTGLGSSSAFTVGFLNALYALDGKIVSREQLAKDALYVEQEMIKENVGSQDQIHAAVGGLNVIEFDHRGFKVRPVVISAERRRQLESGMMVFYTGQTRYASELLTEQIENTRLKKHDDILRNMHSSVSDALHIIGNSNDDEFLEEFGRLMDECWYMKQSLSKRVSNSLIEEAYTKAKKAGAHGGKICGAGGGGFLMLFASPERQAFVRSALNGLLEVTFGFDDTGSSIIYIKS